MIVFDVKVRFKLQKYMPAQQLPLDIVTAAEKVQKVLER